MTSKRNNAKKTGSDNSTKRPASSSPATKVVGQGSTFKTFTDDTPSAENTAKRTRVSADDSTMDVDKPLSSPAPTEPSAPTGSGSVETTSTTPPPAPDIADTTDDTSLEASTHAPSSADKGKSPEKSATLPPERA